MALFTCGIANANLHPTDFPVHPINYVVFDTFLGYSIPHCQSACIRENPRVNFYFVWFVDFLVSDIPFVAFHVA